MVQPEYYFWAIQVNQMKQRNPLRLLCDSQSSLLVPEYKT